MTEEQGEATRLQATRLQASLRTPVQLRSETPHSPTALRAATGRLSGMRHATSMAQNAPSASARSAATASTAAATRDAAPGKEHGDAGSVVRRLLTSTLGRPFPAAECCLSPPTALAARVVTAAKWRMPPSGFVPVRSASPPARLAYATHLTQQLVLRHALRRWVRGVSRMQSGVSMTAVRTKHCMSRP